MAWNTPPDKSAGDQFTEAMWDDYVKGNTQHLYDTKGVELITSTTFTAQSAVTLDNVFTTRHWHYLLTLYITASTTLTTNVNLRASGSTDSTANYDTQNFFAQDTGLSGSRTQNGTAWNIAGLTSTSIQHEQIEFYAPASAVYTGATYKSLASLHSTITIVEKTYSHTVAAAYDGFTLTTTTGTISGSLRLYGYLA